MIALPWRSAFRPGSRRRSTRAETAASEPICSTLASDASRIDSGTEALRRLCDEQRQGCLVIHRAKGRSDRAADLLVGLGAEPLAEPRQRLAIVGLLHGIDGGEADRGVGVGQGVADRAEDDGRPFPIHRLRRGLALRRAGAPPLAVPGAGLVVDLREGEEGLRPLVGGSGPIGGLGLEGVDRGGCILQLHRHKDPGAHLRVIRRGQGRSRRLPVADPSQCDPGREGEIAIGIGHDRDECGDRLRVLEPPESDDRLEPDGQVGIAQGAYQRLHGPRQAFGDRSIEPEVRVRITAAPLAVYPGRVETGDLQEPEGAGGLGADVGRPRRQCTEERGDFSLDAVGVAGVPVEPAINDPDEMPRRDGVGLRVGQGRDDGPDRALPLPLGDLFLISERRLCGRRTCRCPSSPSSRKVPFAHASAR